MDAQFSPRICTWEDLSLTDTEKLLKCCSTLEDMHRALCDVLSRENGDSKQTVIELDMYSYALFFAQKNNFSAPQTSAFFTILKSVHSLCISTPFDNQDQVLELFNNLMICHGVTRPPYSVALFSLAQVKTITHYVLSTYFKHFKLYKYAFTKRVRLDINILYDGEGSEVGSPLDTGVTKEEEKVKLEGEGKDEEVVQIEESMQSAAALDPVDLTDVASASGKESELQEIVSSCLNQKLRDLQSTVEHEMAMHEKQLSEKIDTLEQLIIGKTSKTKKAS